MVSPCPTRSPQRPRAKTCRSVVEQRSILMPEDDVRTMRERMLAGDLYRADDPDIEAESHVGNPARVIREI